MTSIASNMEVRIVSPAEFRARRERLRIGVASGDGPNDKAADGGQVSWARSRGTLRTTTTTVAVLPPVRSPTIIDVQRAVAHCAELTVAQLLVSRIMERLRARLAAVHIVTMFCRTNNASAIGRMFRRDHSTIIGMRKRAEIFLARDDRKLRELIDKSCAHLRSIGFELVGSDDDKDEV